MSNFIGADFSTFSLVDSLRVAAGVVPDLSRGAFVAAAFATAGFVATGFAAAGLGTDLVGFTATLGKTGFGVDFAGARAGFLGKAAFGVAFFGIALPGFLADLIGFFEGM
jgi:hypothetical protein